MNLLKFCIAMLFLAGLAAAYEEEWAKHAKKQNLTGAKHQHRKKHFKKAHDMIEAHNKAKKHRYRLGHNHFSHMSDEEKQQHLGLILQQPHPSLVLNATTPEMRDNLPLSVDYRNDSCMQPVKSQGACGSCWIFAGTAVLEFNSCAKTGKPVSLSEQQSVDCYGSNGCKGGDPAWLWQYAAANGGIATESAYPYTANWNNGTCYFKPSQAAVTVSTSNPVYYFAVGDIAGMMATLDRRNLVAVSIHVPDNFFHVTDGIYDGPDCSGPVNHEITLVGYGTSKELQIDYWVIRNSWGSGWGQSGYMLFKRGVNLCKIEDSGRATTVNTGDVPLGVPYNFQWNTSSDGLVKYSNCSYGGDTLFSKAIGSMDDCGTQCAAYPTCDYFTYWGMCELKSKSAKQVIRLAASLISNRCGDVIKRPNFNWVSGSNGLAMYGQNCDYTSYNSQDLQWQYSDQADCGAICALNSTCAYFTYSGSTCYMYAVANQSLGIAPWPYTSSSSSCGYVTKSSLPYAPNWQSKSLNQNAVVMSSPNCGYIGTDPADVGMQKRDYDRKNELDCANYCAAITTCSYYRWDGTNCYRMSIVQPVVYYSVAGSCGYVVTRPTINWTSGPNGLSKYAPNCGYTSVNRIELQWQSYNVNGDCGTICAITPSCAYFATTSTRCNMYAIANNSLSSIPLMYPSTYYSSCGYVTKSSSPYPPNWQSKSLNQNAVVMSSPNCGYIGTDPADFGIQWKDYDKKNELDCANYCATVTTCSHYRWDGTYCYRMSIVKPVTFYTPQGSCGYVVTRPTINWTSGPNGLSKYAPNCGYTSDNRKELQWQYYDVDGDCGTICAVTPSCAYFAVVGWKCNMYAIVNTSLASAPTMYPSSYYSSCGYVTKSSLPYAPKWVSGANGQVMSAPNCAYIGTDPADVGMQWNNYFRSSESDCAAKCVSSQTCSYYRWDGKWCYSMSIVQPVLYYSPQGSCGYVVKH